MKPIIGDHFQISLAIFHHNFAVLHSIHKFDLVNPNLSSRLISAQAFLHNYETNHLLGNDPFVLFREHDDSAYFDSHPWSHPMLEQPDSVASHSFFFVSDQYELA